MEASIQWESASDVADGAIMTVVFTGRLLPGSAGNELTRQFVDDLNHIVRTQQPAGVVLDLTGCDYTSGDAIGGLAYAFLDRVRSRRWIIPVAIVATGRTATALAPLLEPPWILSNIGAQLFDGREAAIAYVRSALSGLSHGRE
jgi:hypothetical protein